MWVIIIGNLIDGFRFVGPFRSSEDAADWARDFPVELEGVFVLDLISPDTMISKAHEFTRRSMQ